MSRFSSFVFLALTVSSALAAGAPPAEIYSPLVSSKILATAKSRPDPNKYPQNTDTGPAGIWQYFGANGWTSGFMPDLLYKMNERAALCPSKVDKVDWVELGREWSTALIPLEYSNGVGHDVGFLSFPFVSELSINPSNQTAIDGVSRFAAVLASRFNAVVGCTRSWDASDPTDFQVIIDNMMNLEVLFQASKLTGNQDYIAIAKSHADKTMQNHVRADGSSFHVVEYNSTTGAVIKQRTAQGYSDSSTWARGQAWGIYGFANMHKNTKITPYIETARKMATYYLDHIPSSGLVPWDFNAPTPAPMDSSAATIAATGLLLLSQEETALGNHDAADRWASSAIKILNDTVNFAWAPKWQSLLSNGTINKPANNFDTGIIYGDYYLVESGNMLVRMGLAGC